MVAALGVPERRACRVLGQHRSTQRKPPSPPDDEAGLTADIIALATQYGRYGYRRITALLRHAGWQVNRKRVERIWRREGLKVPHKQPKKGRLWLNDGSCVRLRPERPNHVWSYDFVEDRTHNGRKYRMLNIVDEFTRECLAIRVQRRLNSIDVIDAALGPVRPARRAWTHPVRQWPGVRGHGRAGVDRRGRRQNRLHRAGQPLGERLHRELQRPSCATSCSTARSSTLSRRPRSSSKAGGATTTPSVLIRLLTTSHPPRRSHYGGLRNPGQLRRPSRPSRHDRSCTNIQSGPPNGGRPIGAHTRILLLQ